ncbi:Sin3 associated polypeptide p18-domain-containing protein [Aspergillus ambiguus]|uniref:SAP18 family protein n=1 Tax=Aspergillus ambiguus TaxID=176160 RepID=UPI003CCDB076
MAKPIDRQATTPFHLKLFYQQHNYHHLSDFAIPSSPGASSGGPVSGPNAIRTSHSQSIHSTAHLPAQHLQIYTWQSCSLRELSQLLTSALPHLLPDPAVGTRLCFRLIYPDTKAAATLGPDAAGRGRYLSKDLGSVVVGPREGFDEDDGAAPAKGPLRMQGADAEKTLQEARFVIGDYIDCAILPPLEDGSVAPPLTVGRGAISSNVGGGMRAFRDAGAFGGRSRGGRGGGPGGDRAIPPGDWRRGERLPDGGPGSGPGPGRGRRGWAPY